MTIKQNSNRKYVVTSIILALVLLAGAGVLLINNESNAATDSDGTVNQNEDIKIKSPFSFNESAVGDWYQGPANGDSMTLFGGRAIDPATGKESTDTHFAYIHLKHDGVSEEDWLKDLESRDDPDYNFVVGEILPATLETSKGSIEYQLHTYTNQLKEGKVKSPYGLNDAEVHGYIPYGDSYFLVQGYATPANLLPEAITAINSFSYNN